MSDRARPTRLWMWALWFSVVACLLQATLVIAARLGAGRLVQLGRDFVWMSLIADLAVVNVAAAIVFVVSRPLSSAWRARTALVVFIFLTVYGSMLVVPGLSSVTKLLLAGGIAVQGARLLSVRTEWMDRFFRRSLPMLAAVAVLPAIGLHYSHTLGERGRRAAVAPTAAPNVILIVLDTVRAKGLGLYGYPRGTSPHIDEFAAGAVVFNRAFSTSPWTLPSHASVFTGRQPNELSTDWLRPLDKTYPTLAEAFAARGYDTAGFVANLLYTTHESGLSRGFAAYDDYPVSVPMLLESSWLARSLLGAKDATNDNAWLIRKRASAVNANFLHWVSGRSGRPFFAFLNYFDTHEPYLAPPPFDTKFGSGPLPDVNVRRNWNRQQIQRSIDAYDGSLAYLDQEIGELLQALRSRGLWENTVIVITSDHGEQFGEHGLFDHANSLYRQVLQVPLVMSFPGRWPAGRRIDATVSLVDLPATLLETTAADGPLLPGRSLAGFWRGDPPAPRPLFAHVTKGINIPEWQPVGRGAVASVFANGLHYIRGADGEEHLYDLNDQAEEIDLMSSLSAGDRLPELRRMLDGSMRKSTATLTNSLGR